MWSPGDMLVIDWGQIGPLWVFCAVLAWSRWRFVYFADNQRADTTFGALAACFEALDGVPKAVLSDRMGCLKGGTVAGVVVPTADYVRLATHYRFRPDFCRGNDPESKGLVERLVGYAKSDLMIPQDLKVDDLSGANAAGITWCAEVNAQVHSEICAVPAERLVTERDVLRELPQLRARIGTLVVRKVDKLSCVRFGSARYSVPTRHIGKQVEVRVADGTVQILGHQTEGAERLFGGGLGAFGHDSAQQHDRRSGRRRPTPPGCARGGGTARCGAGLGVHQSGRRIRDHRVGRRPRGAGRAPSRPRPGGSRRRLGTGRRLRQVPSL